MNRDRDTGLLLLQDRSQSTIREHRANARETLIDALLIEPPQPSPRAPLYQREKIIYDFASFFLFFFVCKTSMSFANRTSQTLYSRILTSGFLMSSTNTTPYMRKVLHWIIQVDCKRRPRIGIIVTVTAFFFLRSGWTMPISEFFVYRDRPPPVWRHTCRSTKQCEETNVFIIG